MVVCSLFLFAFPGLDCIHNNFDLAPTGALFENMPQYRSTAISATFCFFFTKPNATEIVTLDHNYIINATKGNSRNYLSAPMSPNMHAPSSLQHALAPSSMLRAHIRDRSSRQVHVLRDAIASKKSNLLYLSPT